MVWIFRALKGPYKLAQGQERHPGENRSPNHNTLKGLDKKHV